MPGINLHLSDVPADDKVDLEPGALLVQLAVHYAAGDSLRRPGNIEISQLTLSLLRLTVLSSQY